MKFYSSPSLRSWLALAVCLAAASAGLWLPQPSAAQAPARSAPVNVEKQRQADKQAEAALAAEKKGTPNAPAAAAPAAAKNESPSLWEVYWMWGGPLMIPISALSVIVVIFSVERLLGLRRRRVVPPELVEGLGQLAGKQGGFDPRAAYQLCQQYPSAAANVVRSVLLKVGRPHSEVEHTVEEACDREAAKLYKNVRTINLAVSVAPLLGLLGTVQGMISCFYTAASLSAGDDKYRALSEGIYKALVTTFGGLVVAIPASVFAHYFEGRIQSLFREIDELLLGLLPQLERYEGKMRIGRSAETPRPPVAAPPAPPSAPEPPMVSK